MGIVFDKYGSVKGCRPDYIFRPDYWADAKLSGYADTSIMRKRYLQYCETLTIFYLIGTKTTVPTYSDGTNKVNVYSQLEGEIPEIRDKYTALFKGLEAEYNHLMKERDSN